MKSSSDRDKLHAWQAKTHAGYIDIFDPSLLTAATLDPFGKLAALASDVEEALSLLQCRVGVSSGAQWISIDGLSL